MTITVKRERPDQRRHHRVTAPLFVSVDGSAEKFKARDWSLGGVCIDGYTGALPEEGGTLALHLTLPFQGFDISFDVEAKVVRVEAAINSIGVEYTNLGERETALLRHFIDDLVRGVMSPVEDSIQRIDMPITPVSTEPDPKPKNVAASNRLPARQLVWVGVYAMMGFVVFGYTALVLYSNFFRMEVQTAVVAAPTVKVPARGDGELPYVRVNAGDEVKEGETVIYFTDYELEREIDDAKIKIQEKEAALNSLLFKRASELEVMTEYAAVELQGIEQAKVGLEALEAEARAAALRAARINKLLAQGLTTKPKAEEAEQWFAEARAKLEIKRLEVKEQMRRAEAGLGQRYFNGREFVGNAGATESDIKMARYQIALSNQAHEALLRHRERLAVKAPFDGRVLDIPVPRNASVKRGDIIAVFEKDDERYISAFLTQDEVIKVSKGDQASVYFPALNTSLRADVVSVDRTSGFKDEVSRRFSWRGAEDRSAEVRLDLAKDNDPAVMRQVTSGLPAIVLFEAQSTNPILAAVWRKIGRFSCDAPAVSWNLNAPYKSYEATYWPQGWEKWNLGVLLKIGMYFCLCAMFLSLVPNTLFDPEVRQVTYVIGFLGIWRFSWWGTHAIRAVIYARFVYPTMREMGLKVWNGGWRPRHLHFMMTTFREDKEITQSVIRGIATQVREAGIPATLWLGSGDRYDEDIIEEELKLNASDLDITLRIIRQNVGGKRMAIGLVLRAMSRADVPNDDIVVFLDGDFIMAPNAVSRCLPLFKLYPDLEAVTTDEDVICVGPKWMQSMLSMRFAQRRMAMQSHSLSGRVLTLTGRMSVFRVKHVKTREFCRLLEADYLDHWLWGEFRFLSGDDKSTLYYMMKHKARLLYVPDAMGYTVEIVHGNGINRMVQNYRRWSGNMLRNGARVIALGPRHMPFFIWWCFVDQRIAMWTMLVNPMVALAAALLHSGSYLIQYFLFLAISRLVLSLVLWGYARKIDMMFPVVMYVNQVINAGVKVYSIFRLSKQRWFNRGDQKAAFKGNRLSAMARETMAGVQTTIAVSALFLIVTIMTGLVDVPGVRFLYFLTHGA